jgi:hypothetical protein
MLSVQEDEGLMMVSLYLCFSIRGETDPYRPASLKYVAGKSRPTAVISASLETLTQELSTRPNWGGEKTYAFFIELPH